MKDNLDFTYDPVRFNGLPAYVDQLKSEGVKYISILVSWKHAKYYDLRHLEQAGTLTPFCEIGVASSHHIPLESPGYRGGVYFRCK